jgi:hypothetical protein
LACAFALGTALAALGGQVGQRAALELAAVACGIAGGLVLGEGLSRR